MLTIDLPERIIPGREYFNNRTQEFIIIEEKKIPPIHLQLEHSLMSIAKWESKWHEAFLGKEQLDGERLLDYIKCMTINTQKDPGIYDYLTEEAVLEIVKYMQDSHSAWEINPKKKGRKSNKITTVELIYYNMIQLGIPMECEKWHFNRLMALMDFCDCQGGSRPGGGSPQKRSQREVMEMYAALNARNRKKYNSKG